MNLAAQIIGLLGILSVFSWIGYHLGYNKGYWTGSQDELDKAARRTERIKRFYER